MLGFQQLLCQVEVGIGVVPRAQTTNGQVEDRRLQARRRLGPSLGGVQICGGGSAGGTSGFGGLTGGAGSGCGGPGGPGSGVGVGGVSCAKDMGCPFLSATPSAYPLRRGPTLATMDLRPYVDDDIWLTEELETDPEVMSELGGPQPPDSIPRTHARRLQAVEDGNWWLVIEPEPGIAAGTIGVWPTTQDGVEMFEVGWLVLPRFQRRGLASAALAALIERCRASKRIDAIHAFPGATNAPSNALCRRAGFTWIEEREVLYGDRPLAVNHWELSTS